MITSTLKHVSLLLGVALLAACGGGGGGASSNPPAVSGITGVGYAQGAVTGFGSIFVNGVEYSTSAAQIHIDGGAGSESQLKIGQVVTIKGAVNADGVTGRADDVSFDHDVEGPITSVDTATNSFVVLGQTVIVNGGTTFDGATALGDLSVGMEVEVSGFRDANGAVVASHIQVRAAGGELEVNGVVANFDGNAKRFDVNSLTVDYTTAQLDNGTPSNGACVEAKGTQLTGGVLTATKVEVKSCTLGTANGDSGELEGVISRFASSSDFDIAGQHVITNAQTTFSGGAAADLRLNLKVEAEGSFDASGALVAKKVAIRTEASARLTGTVDAVDSNAGTLTVFGITIQTASATTRFDDKSNAQVRSFSIADIHTGDYVEVRGTEGSAAGTLTALIVERRDPANKFQLQAVARNVAQPNLTLLGVAVVAAGNAQYRDAAGAALNASAFFSQAVDHTVKVEGAWSAGTFTADKLELENP
jgi:hypothetical protein